MAGDPGPGRLRKGRRTDVAYYFLNRLVTKVIGGVIIAVFVLGLARAIGLSLTVDDLKGLSSRDTLITRQPIIVQIALFIAVADFAGYWMHRLFHFQPTLWRYHAVHHSSRQVDWLASVRVHPVNDVVTNAVQAAPLLALGFSPGTLGAYVALLGLFAVLLHANVPWSFGPMRYVISSPVFHRWHHTTEKQGIDKNFAGFFPAWDLLFGTFYMPAGEQPMEFGVLGEAVPEGIWRQLLYPLRPGQALVENR